MGNLSPQGIQLHTAFISTSISSGVYTSVLHARRETKGIIDGFFPGAKGLISPVIYEGERVGTTSSQLKAV